MYLLLINVYYSAFRPYGTMAQEIKIGQVVDFTENKLDKIKEHLKKNNEELSEDAIMYIVEITDDNTKYTITTWTKSNNYYPNRGNVYNKDFTINFDSPYNSETAIQERLKTDEEREAEAKAEAARKRKEKPYPRLIYDNYTQENGYTTDYVDLVDIMGVLLSMSLISLPEALITLILDNYLGDNPDQKLDEYDDKTPLQEETEVLIESLKEDILIELHVKEYSTGTQCAGPGGHSYDYDVYPMNDAQFDTFRNKMQEYGLDISWGHENHDVWDESEIDELKEIIDHNIENGNNDENEDTTEIRYEMWPRQGSDEDKRRWKEKWKDLIIEHYKLKENRPTIRDDNNSKRQKLWEQYNLKF